VAHLDYLYVQTKEKQVARISEYLSNCLYFTANILSRSIGKMADTAFREVGISPSHAFMMMLVNETPGITQKELSAHLDLAPSTLTRFADKLVYRGYIKRAHKGKTVRIYPTQTGKELQPRIEAAWKRLYEDYSKVLGKEAGEELTKSIDLANKRLGDLS